MSKRSCVLPLILAVACAPAHSALRSVQGEARDPASGDLLYLGEHLLGGHVERPLKPVGGSAAWPAPLARGAA